MNNHSYRFVYPGIASRFLLLIISCFFSECLDDDPIKIQSLYPSIGCKGNTLSIIGWGFGDVKSNNVVKINGITAEIIRNIPDMIVVTLPDTVTSGKITVQVGNKIITGPEYSITGPRYFIKFKADGAQKYFESCDPSYDYDKECTVGRVFTAWVGVCDYSASKFNGSVIQSWKGQKFSFTDEKHVVDFRFNEPDAEYRSIYANSQADSEMTITDVIADPSVIVPNVYVVTGTFKCNVATPDGNTVVAITDGEFSVRFKAPN